MFALLIAGLVSTNCGSFEEADKFLRGLGEEMTAIGRTETGVMLLYVKPDGSTWTIVTLDQEAKACIISDGVNLRVKPRSNGA